MLASEEHEPSMRTVAPLWATALLLLAVVLLALVAIAPKPNEQRRRSFSDYVIGLGTSSTRDSITQLPMMLCSSNYFGLA